MDFQIEKIILWPKNNAFKYKTLEFKFSMINVITGASRTGKSAIIPIIDYCMASNSCQIPVRTIRNACSWFGVIFRSEGNQILLARREPGTQRSTDDMMIIEDNIIEIPNNPCKNTTADAVKKYLDQIASLSFLDIDSDTTNQYFGRPSFRDLMAFCFQPQNIIANANTLFYKADTTEHRTKLINIFPYILGAVNPDVLAKRQIIFSTEKELKRKEREFENIKSVADKWKIEIKGWLSSAIELGLLMPDQVYDDLDYDSQVQLLSSLENKSAFDSVILKANIENSSMELIQLRDEEAKISLELSYSKNRFTEMTQLMGSIHEYRSSLNIQVDRLNISKWLKSMSDSDHECPFCGSANEISKEIINNLNNNLEDIEKTADLAGNIPAAFEREYESVKEEIRKLTEKLFAVQKRIKIQNNLLYTSNIEKYTIESVSRFLGQVQYAKETFKKIGLDSELLSIIEELRRRLSDLQSQVNEGHIKKKIDSALNNIAAHAMRLLPLLDVERPNDFVKIDYKNLTVIVSDKSGRDDFLWEIGSGSNWVAYHLSTLLAFHIFFSSLQVASVPNFIVFDQPSQVYFPQAELLLDESKTMLDPQIPRDEDKEAVMKMFKVMGEAINQAKRPMQIIVLEHADDSVWGGLEHVYKVCEWRGDSGKLVPEEWLQGLSE